MFEIVNFCFWTWCFGATTQVFIIFKYFTFLSEQSAPILSTLSEKIRYRNLEKGYLFIWVTQYSQDKKKFYGEKKNNYIVEIQRTLEI